VLIRIATLPFRAVRKVARAFTGGGGTPPPAPRPADAWELRQAREARGQAGPAPRAAPAAPEDDAHSHDHGHDHGHSHDHAPPLQVRVQDTPNPAARKFALDRRLGDPTSRSFQSAAEAEGDALASALFALPGVRSVFAVEDFVTVTAEAEADWGRLSPAVVSVLQERAG
jgi:hypothetical protein